MKFARYSGCFFALPAYACLLSFCTARAQSTGGLIVAITDQRGFPAPNSYLTLVSRDQVRQAKSDTTGKVEFTALPFQTYELEVWSASFADISLPNIQITTKDPKILNVRLKLFASTENACPPPLRIEAVPGSNRPVVYEERKDNVQVSGVVAEIAGSRPVKEATITLVKPDRPDRVLSQAVSDVNGLYEFKDLEPGKYTLTVSYKGNVEKPGNFHFWVTRGNLTRIGRILFGLSLTNDICGGPITITSPDNEKPTPTPELIPPR